MAKTKLDSKDDDPTDILNDSRRIVRMPSGTLVFALDVNLLKCSAEDRTFLFGVIDMLDAYDKLLAERAAVAAQTESA